MRMPWRWRILLFVGIGAFLAGRFHPRHVTSPRPFAFEPVGLGLEGKRLDLDLSAPSNEALAAQLSRLYGAHVIVDPKNRPASDERAASLQMRQATLHEALNRLAGSSDAEPAYGYRVRGRAILATDPLWPEEITRIYDLRPLYRRLIKDYRPPIFLWTRSARYRLRTLPVQSPSTSPVNGLFDGGQVSEPNPRAELEGAIRDTIAPRSWKEDGGRWGSLRNIGDFLIVTNHPSAHAELERYLNRISLQKSAAADGVSSKSPDEEKP